MKNDNNRRSFLKTIALGGVGAVFAPTNLLKDKETNLQNRHSTIKGSDQPKGKRKYNAPYKGEFLNRIAFPVGGIGAGMFCLEGSGAISHMSVRNRPEIFNEPGIFSAIW